MSEARHALSAPPSTQRSPSGLGIVLLRTACVVLALATASLALRSDRNALDFPLSEDGYYSLSVARNVALGRGVTIDGEAWTNGFQPLFTFLCVPGFLLAGGDRVLGVRAVLVLHWVFLVATAWCLGAVARDLCAGTSTERLRLVFWTTVFLYLASFSAFLNHFNGLETGCVLFLYACAWRVFAARPLAGDASAGDRSLRRHVGLGALLGLCVLGRVDAVFLVALVALAVAVVRASSLAWRGVRFAAVAGTAFLVSSPWWAFNLWLSGSLMPSSGSAQQIPLAELSAELRERRLWFAATEPLELAMPWLDASLAQRAADAVGLSELARMDPHDGFVQPMIVARASLAVAVLLGAIWLVRRPPLQVAATNYERGRAARALGFGGLLLLFTLVLVLYYVWTSFATHHYWRYFSPTLLVFTAAAGVVVARASARWRPLTLVLLPVLLLACSAPLLTAVFYAHTSEIVQHRYKGRRNSYYAQQVALVERGVPEGERVASRNSGTLGFFRDGVVNLDGKVNPAALAHKDELWRYLDAREVDWLCDWPDHVALALGGDPSLRGWELVDREGGFRLYHRE